LVPAVDGGDDFVRIGGPDKWLWDLVCLLDEAGDGGLQFGNGAEDTRCRRCLDCFAKYPSTALSQGQDVGVKWRKKRLWRTNHARNGRIARIARLNRL
jgi:hypothetical protein